MRMTISMKMYVGYVLVLVLLLITSLTAIVKMTGMGEKAEEVDRQWLPSVLYLGKISQQMTNVDRTQMRLFLDPNRTELTDLEHTLNKAVEDLKKDQKEYEKLLASEAERTLYNRFTKDLDSYLGYLPEIKKAARDRDNDKGNMLSKEAEIFFLEADKKLDQLLDVNLKAANDVTGESVSLFHSGRTIAIILSMAALVLGMSIAYYMSRMISQPLKQMDEQLKRVAQGDLSCEPDQPLGTQCRDRSCAGRRARQGLCHRRR